MSDTSDGETKVAPDVGVATTIDTEVDSKGKHPTDGEPVIRAGDVVSERYRVVDLIGKGGMGLVFRALHIAIDKPVAIKVLGEEYAGRKSVVERFMLEARAASLIRDPHIVDITDFGFVREGMPYFVMEYLEGQTLADRIHDQRRLPWAKARAIMLQICTALQAAHDKGVIHRDVKPENVFLLKRDDAAPFVKVLDFGIAKIIDDGDKNLTRTGTVMGTAGYMSPEQAQSLPLDVRTDVYSAGVILYEMLTGRVPFDGDGFVGVLTKHVTERPLSLRQMAPEAKIPAALDRVVLRALHKDREDRYASAAEFSAALTALGEDGAEPGWRRWAPAGVVTAVIVGAAAWTFSGLGGPPDDAPSAPEAPAAPSPAAGQGTEGSGNSEAPTPRTRPSPPPVGTLPDVRPVAQSTMDPLPPPPPADASTGETTASIGLPGIDDPDLTTEDGDGSEIGTGATETTAGASPAETSDHTPADPPLPTPPTATSDPAP